MKLIESEWIFKTFKIFFFFLQQKIIINFCIDQWSLDRVGFFFSLILVNFMITSIHLIGFLFSSSFNFFFFCKFCFLSLLCLIKVLKKPKEQWFLVIVYIYIYVYISQANFFCSNHIWLVLLNSFRTDYGPPKPLPDLPTDLPTTSWVWPHTTKSLRVGQPFFVASVNLHLCL